MNRATHGDMRRGKLSGSRAAALMSGSYRQWNSLLKELRKPPPFYGVSARTPAPLAWGTNHEEQALAIWWDRHPRLDLVNPVCVAYHDPEDVLWSRHVVVSPDRMIYDPKPARVIGGLELKCPFLEGKLAAWRAQGVCPPEHFDQCAWGQLVTNIKQWRFVAFDPRLEEPEDFFEVEVAVPDGYLAKMYEQGTVFLRMLESGAEFEPTVRSAKRMKEMFGGH